MSASHWDILIRAQSSTILISIAHSWSFNSGHWLLGYHSPAMRVFISNNKTAGQSTTKQLHIFYSSYIFSVV